MIFLIIFLAIGLCIFFFFFLRKFQPMTSAPDDYEIWKFVYYNYEIWKHLIVVIMRLVIGS